jgi:ABC-type uncharacterized transport system ATPase subunit
VTAIELVGITKTFPGVVANDDVTLTVKRGEVHCLLGENGAGKSTLMSIVTGMQKPDAGRLRVDGQDVAIDSPRAALRRGIGAVHQHSTLMPALTVLENLMLGDTRALRLDPRGARARLARLSAMLGIEIDGDARGAELALGRQQQVEIIKALWRASRVLILDEPTSMLTPQAVGELHAILERLKGDGVAIVLITHKLDEARALADRISILRAGRLVATLDSAQLDDDAIVRLMFGEDTDLAPDRPTRSRPPAGDVVLELDGACAAGAGDEPGIEDVTFALHAGEVLGVAGVDGNGQRELAEAIGGQRRLTHGEVRLFGAAVGRMGVAAREKLGLRSVTDDRLGEGVVGTWGVRTARPLPLRNPGGAGSPTRARKRPRPARRHRARTRCRGGRPCRRRCCSEASCRSVAGYPSARRRAETRRHACARRRRSPA